MKEPIRAFKTQVLNGAAVCSPQNSKEPVAPAGNLAVFLDALFQQTTALEAPPFPGPKQALHSARLKP